MNFTDFKLWYIKRDDDIHISEAAVRFYEGKYQTINGKEVYVRTKRLETLKDLKHLAKKVDGKYVLKGLVEKNGSKAVIYLPEDFGVISTDDELRAFLNKELAKDKSREPIDEQKIII